MNASRDNPATKKVRLIERAKLVTKYVILAATFLGAYAYMIFLMVDEKSASTDDSASIAILGLLQALIAAYIPVEFTKMQKMKQLEDKQEAVDRERSRALYFIINDIRDAQMRVTALHRLAKDINQKNVVDMSEIASTISAVSQAAYLLGRSDVGLQSYLQKNEESSLREDNLHTDVTEYLERVMREQLAGRSGDLKLSRRVEDELRMYLEGNQQNGDQSDWTEQIVDSVTRPDMRP